MLAAWRREGALEETLHLPFGDRPATWRAGQQIADVAVHGWDIATATGHATDLDPEIGRLSLEGGREGLTPEFRGDEASGRAFGPEAPIAEDAPLYDRLYDRLAAFFGRVTAETNPPVIHYLEIVSPAADTLTALYRRLHGLSFGPPDPDLGQARAATRTDGSTSGA